MKKIGHDCRQDWDGKEKLGIFKPEIFTKLREWGELNFNHNQASGLVRGPRRLRGRSGIEALGCAVKDCHKAAPKEEQGGKGGGLKPEA